MGYRSDWKLVFNTAGRANEVMLWLKREAQMGSGHARLVEEILNYAVQHQDADVIELSETSWKLWDWDQFIIAINDRWGDDEEVDYAWVTIGEDYDDIEICNGDWTYIYIERYIGDTNLDPVPKAERKDLEAEAQPRPPLKCTCGGFGGHKDWCDLVTGEYTDGVY